MGGFNGQGQTVGPAFISSTSVLLYINWSNHPNEMFVREKKTKNFEGKKNWHKIFDHFWSMIREIYPPMYVVIVWVVLILP